MDELVARFQQKLSRLFTSSSDASSVVFHGFFRSVFTSSTRNGENKTFRKPLALKVHCCI